MKKIFSGVLSLNKPIEPQNPVQWYSNKIAGVPFALRNILTLQRVNIKNLAIFMEDPDGELKKSFSKILDDSRISLELVWIGNIDQLKKWIQNNPDPIYIFKGSVLYDKKTLHDLLYSSHKNEAALSSILPVDLNHLENTLIESPNRSPVDSSINRTEEPSTGFPVYIQGSKENEIQKPEDFKTLHEAQVSGSGLNHDSPITRILSRPASHLITRWLLNTPITPNQITLFSFFLGLLSAVLFLQGDYWTSITASTLLILSTWVDGADGEIARIKFMETATGKILDIYCDNIIHFLIFSAIGYGVYDKTGQNMYLYLGGLAGLASLLAFFLLSPILIENRSSDKQMSHYIEPSLAEKFANRDFIHFVFLVAVIDQLGLFIMIAAVGASLFAGFLIYSRVSKPRAV